MSDKPPTLPASSSPTLAHSDPEADGFKATATAGAMATGLSQAVRLAVQIGSVVVLSRLLGPDAFGVMAMTAPVLAFVMMFQDLGLTQATIQRRDITSDQISALFWINLGVSLILGLAIALASPLVGWFYHDVRAGHMTAAFGLVVVVIGLGSQHSALLNRNMRFGTLSVIDALSAVAGLVAAGVLALNHASYWSLFGGSLVSAAVPTVGAWLAQKWIPARPGKPADLRSLLTFGADLTGFNLVNFFARNLDNILIGRVWGGGALGLYDRAYKLLLMPLQQVNAPLSRVMLPILSRLVPEPDRYRHAYLRTLGQMLLLVLPGVAFMVGTAPSLIPLLLGAQWAGAAPIFQALGLAALIQPITSTTGWLLISQGRTRHYVYGGLFGTAMNIAAFVIGLRWGAIGVATAYAISEYLKAPGIWWLVTREGPLRAGQMARASLPHLGAAFLSLATVVALQNTLSAPTLVVLVAALVGSYAVSLPLLALTAAGREALGQTFALAQAALGRVRRRSARDLEA